MAPEEAQKLLATAAPSGELEAAIKALDGGADPNAADAAFFNYTALHMAAGKWQTDVCKLLLARKAAVDPRSQTDETPLIMAARAKHRPVVDLLLFHGADRSAKTNYGNSSFSKT